MNDEKATMTCEWNCKTNRFVIECKGTNNNSLYLDYMEKPEWLEYSEFIQFIKLYFRKQFIFFYINKKFVIDKIDSDKLKKINFRIH